MADYDDGLRVVHHNGRVPSPVLGYEPEVKPVESIETITHKTILVGDSGVGKTSLLVQFDQGKFQAGSFAATVGIGFTVGVINFYIDQILVFLFSSGPELVTDLAKPEVQREKNFC